MLKNTVKRVLLIAITTLAGIGAAAIFTGCSPSKQKLETPSDLDIDEYCVLTWAAVENATEYVVSVNDEEYTATENVFDLFPVLSKHDTIYEIAVKAYGNLEYTFDSDFSEPIEYDTTMSSLTKESLGFLINDDGKTCTLDVSNALYISGPVFIPSVIKGYTVTNIRNSAFLGAKNLTGVYIPDSVQYIGILAFSGCESLKRVRLSESIERLSAGVFKDCKSLESIYLPRSIENIDCRIASGIPSIYFNPFSGCDSLKEINVDEDNPYFKSDGGCIMDKSTNSVVVGINSAVIPSYAVGIESCAFAGCNGLTHIDLPYELEYINLGAFAYCVNLSEIDVPESVTSLGNGSTFYGCDSMKKATLPRGVTQLSSTFYGCSSLTEITIPNTVTNINSFAFYGCGSLERITVEEGNAVYKSDGNCLIDIENNSVVRGCKNSVIPEYIETIGLYAFNECTELKEIIIPKSVKVIEKYAFSNCNNVSGITLSEDIAEIQSSAFGPYGISGDIPKEGVSIYIPYSRQDYNSLEDDYGRSLWIGVSGYPVVFYGCDIRCEDGISYVYSYTYSTREIKASYSYYLSGDKEQDEAAKAEAIEKQEYITNPRAPARSGYVFKGWTTVENGTEAEYAAYTNDSGKLCALSYFERQEIPDGTKLYAVWEKI